MWLGLKEVQYCECIGRDIGCGFRVEDVMLWSGGRGRLGVDLCGLVGLAALFLRCDFLEILWW